jgi:hypothetical protein
MGDALLVKHVHHYLKNVFDYLLLNKCVCGLAMSLGGEFDSSDVRKFLYSSNEPCPHCVIPRTRLMRYHLVEFILQVLEQLSGI